MTTKFAAFAKTKHGGTTRPRKDSKEGGADAFDKLPALIDHFKLIRQNCPTFEAPIRVSAPCTGTGNAILAAFELLGRQSVVPMHLFDTDRVLEGRGSPFLILV